MKTDDPRFAVRQRITTAIDRWRAGAGDVLVLSGEPGLGKSFILSWIESLRDTSTTVVRVDCRPPIGTINTSAITPLQPFGLAVEQLYLQSEETAKKRLALNVGMSLLSAIPLVGDFVYAVKAVSQDVNEYKRETAALQQKKKAAVRDCIDTLRAVAERQPFILCVDDAQWSDSQSVEVIRQLIDEAGSHKILIIWACSPSVVRRVNTPLATLLRAPAVVERTTELHGVERSDVLGLVRSVIPAATVSDKTLDKLFERSAGTPGIIVEYVKYLQHAGYVGADGVVRDDGVDDLAVRASDHPATDIVLRDISEEDAVTLSICAAEGREFTAFLVAAVMNVDVVTAIRLLRRLAQQTGLIKSVGMRARYGIKTTTYEFTQAFAYTYFLHRPEYEERRALHQRITEILVREHDAASIDDVRHQIAAIISAHSAEAEDEQTTQRMLHESARAAEDIGADDIAVLIRTSLLKASTPEADESVSAETHQDVDIPTTASNGTSQIDLRSIADDIVQGNPLRAVTVCTALLQHSSASDMVHRERLLLRALAARACAEVDRFDEAENLLQAAEDDVTTADDRCILLNVRAAVALRNGHTDLATSYLREAAETSADSSRHLRLLTLGNVILAKRRRGDTDTDRTERHVRKLADAMGTPAIRTDLRL